MATATKRKNKNLSAGRQVKIKEFRFDKDPQEKAELKIGVNLESVVVKPTQLAGLVLTLIRFELIRRDAYPRWKMFLHQVGLRLWDLIAYLNVLTDDEELVKSLKAYYFKSKLVDYDKTVLLREANQLYERLLEKINKVKNISEFSVHKIRAVEQIIE
jgi:hypothetical protein